MKLPLPSAIFLTSGGENALFNRLNELLIAKLAREITLALKVEAKTTPLSVARCSFGITKLRALRGDWSDLRLNSGDFISLNQALVSC